MNQYIAYFKFFLKNAIKFLEKLSDILMFVIEKWVDNVCNSDLRVVEVVHSESGCDDWVVGVLPVVMEWEWMKLRF